MGRFNHARSQAVRAHLARPTATLALLRGQVAPLTYHPSDEVSHLADEIVREIVRLEREEGEDPASPPTLEEVARLVAAVFHARLYADPEDAPLWRAPHATARRFFRARIAANRP